MPHTSRRMVARSGSPGSRITSVMRRPFAQWLRLPRKILRSSANETSSTGLDRFTTMTSGSVAATASGWVTEVADWLATTRLPSTAGQAINRAVISSVVSWRIMRIRSERKSHLQSEIVHARLVAQKGVVVLKFQRDRFTGIKAHPGGRAVAQLHVGKHRLLVGNIHVLVAKIGTVGAELLRNLAVESGRVVGPGGAAKD